jgi:hypothetical protein
VFVSESRLVVDDGKPLMYDAVTLFHGRPRKRCLSGNSPCRKARTGWLAVFRDSRLSAYLDGGGPTEEKERGFMAKRLVVVGGGAGGPSSAAKAKREAADLEVTIFEAGEHVSFAA